MEKIKLTKQQIELLEFDGKNVNKKYYYLSNVYEKIDNEGNYLVKELKELPEGVIKYIENERNKK